MYAHSRDRCAGSAVVLVCKSFQWQSGSSRRQSLRFRQLQIQAFLVCACECVPYPSCIQSCKFYDSLSGMRVAD